MLIPRYSWIPGSARSISNWRAKIRGAFPSDQEVITGLQNLKPPRGFNARSSFAGLSQGNDDCPCVTAFRSEIGRGNLAGLRTNLRQIRGSTTTDAQYQGALARFRKHPDPPGQVLNWVCRDNVDYLDLTQDRLEMNPAH